MNWDLALGVLIGVGVGYFVVKKLDNLPVVISGGKPLDGVKLAASAYRLGVADGESRTAQFGSDAKVISYLQTLG
jgi:hypothetical protein